jgi:hypothetical protein
LIVVVRIFVDVANDRSLLLITVVVATTPLIVVVKVLPDKD